MLFSSIVETLTPVYCLDCGSEGALICNSCLTASGGSLRGTCVRCNRLSPFGRTCLSCRSRMALAGVSVAAYYDGAIKELILGLKFHRQLAAARIAARLIVDRLRSSNLAFDLVTAVPISPQRYRERGYNQSELIAKLVAKQLSLPYRRLLARYGGEHQMGQDRPTRLRQVETAFYSTGRMKAGERVLVIDDVVTTGATLDACARLLKGAGAKSVWGGVVAKH